MQTPYQHAYAKHAPLMRDRWKGCRDITKLAAAKADILETLKLHPADCSYAGKLYAELDAIRDAWMAPIVRGDK
jgi:hypothetical protein